MRIVIADDEANARSRLRRLLSSQTDVEIVGEASDGLEALEVIRETAPELVLLDIEMPELDGVSVAEALGADGPAVIFVTAYDRYAIAAFDQAAADYLVKPVAPARLEVALERVRSRAAQVRGNAPHAPDRLAFKSGGDFIVLDPTEILWVDADGPVVHIHTRAASRMCDETMSDMERRLRDRGFIRIHRSTLCNVAWVIGLEREGERRHYVRIGDEKGTRLSVSRDRLSELRDRLRR
ncbi:MAG: LytTR family DNA-binding domain-containing protein [Myxococcota bacterium]